MLEIETSKVLDAVRHLKRLIYAFLLPIGMVFYWMKSGFKNLLIIYGKNSFNLKLGNFSMSKT